MGGSFAVGGTHPTHQLQQWPGSKNVALAIGLGNQKLPLINKATVGWRLNPVQRIKTKNRPNPIANI